MSGLQRSSNRQGSSLASEDRGRFSWEPGSSSRDSATRSRKAPALRLRLERRFHVRLTDDRASRLALDQSQGQVCRPAFTQAEARRLHPQALEKCGILRLVLFHVVDGGREVLGIRRKRAKPEAALGVELRPLDVPGRESPLIRIVGKYDDRRIDGPRYVGG